MKARSGADQSEKSFIDVASYNSYNDYAAAKVEELSDMIVILCTQYDETIEALQLAQYSWIQEYFKYKYGSKI